MENQSKRLNTTLGELIAAASEVAFEYSQNEKEAYRLTRLALIEILRKSSHPAGLGDEFARLETPEGYLN